MTQNDGADTHIKGSWNEFKKKRNEIKFRKLL